MKKIILSLVVVLALTACGSSKQGNTDDKKIVIGATPSPHAEILNAVKPMLEEKGYTLEITEFSDYNQMNDFVADGSLDANFFQHKPFLEDFNKNKGKELTQISFVHFEPLGIYADDPQGKKSLSLDDINEGDVIAVPNDTTNEARALQLLAANGIIEVDLSKGLNATIKDVTANPKNIVIKELDAALIPALLPDVDYAVINGNYALTNKTEDKVIVTESAKSEAAEKFANGIAVDAQFKDTDKLKALKEAIESEEIREFIETKYKGLVIPVF